MNPKHRTSEEQAKSLPMHRKLRMHFAENACYHAMKRLCETDKDILEELKEKEEKKNAVEAIMETKTPQKRDWRDKVHENKDEREEK